MHEQSDEALRLSARKVYGSMHVLRRAELRRRLLMTPEFFYFADALIEEWLTRGILQPVQPADTAEVEVPGLPAPGTENEWLAISGETGRRQFP